MKSIRIQRNVRGHTYMATDTYGGYIQREARKIMSGENPHIHAMARLPGCEVAKLNTWEMCAKRAGLIVVLLQQADFLAIEDYFIQVNSPYQRNPKCIHGPKKIKRGLGLYTR